MQQSTVRAVEDPSNERRFVEFGVTKLHGVADILDRRWAHEPLRRFARSARNSLGTGSGRRNRQKLVQVDAVDARERQVIRMPAGTQSLVSDCNGVF